MSLSPMPHKPGRHRRTRVEMGRTRDAMVTLARENNPLTVRQLFYPLATAGFIDHAVELEAIPPDRLRSIVRDCISQHIDPDALSRLKAVEAAERQTLLAIAEGGGRP